MLELGALIILGIVSQWIAWRTKVPAILPLLLTGLAVGPLAEHFLGHKLISPIFDNGTGEGLFVREIFFYFVSMAIGIILFEGGLTLKFKEIKHTGGAILKLIIADVVVTLIGGVLAAHFLVGLPLNMSFLFAALIIVTGPTVIAPILRNVPLSPNISTILKWEGILIDPVGALAAVLVFEFILHGHVEGGFSNYAFAEISKVMVIGLGLGFGAAYFLYMLLQRHLVPHYLLNVFTLALVIAAFILSDIIVPESGLLTVVVMGMTLANLKQVPYLDDILEFKESLTILLISVLFIALSANINWADLQKISVWALLLFGIVLLMRPIAVFASTFGSKLSFNEKAFISWVGPRGIVAAGIASVFGLKLQAENVPGADMIVPLVFLIVLGTVLLNATTARAFAKVLGVILEKSNGIAIIGAGEGPRLIAGYLRDAGRHVVLIDKSATNIKQAQAAGFEALQQDIFSDSFDGRFELLDVGYLLALTGSDEVNAFACNNLKDVLGENGTYRFISQAEYKDHSLVPDKAQILFKPSSDFLNFTELTRHHPNIHEITINSSDMLTSHLQMLMNDKELIPLFYKRESGDLEVITMDSHIDYSENMQLVYMGKTMDVV